MVGSLLLAQHAKFLRSVQTGYEALEEPLVTAQNGGCFRGRYLETEASLHRDMGIWLDTAKGNAKMAIPIKAGPSNNHCG